MKASEDAPSSENRVVTDGGTETDDSQEAIDDNLFTRTADVQEPLFSERVRQGFDTYVYAPLAVAMNDWRASVGALILLLFVLMGTVGVWLVDQPQMMGAEPYLLPFQDWAYPLGTGALGQSLLAQVVHATPAMLQMILAGSILSVALGTFIGTVAGYKGGTTDTVMMTITDVVLTIPGLVVVIVLAAVYDPSSPIVIGLILGIDNWPRLARTIRSQVLSIREESFTEASRILGLSQWSILRKDVISNLMPYISVNFANSSRRIIFEAVALYFIGILNVTTAQNWGVMLNTAYNQSDMTDMGQLHWVIVPMVVIILISLGFILFAQGLDRVFNVRLRARHAKTVADDDEEVAESTTQ